MKKKYLLWILCILLIIQFVYYKRNQNKTLICSYQTKNDLYEVSTEYKIYHKKDIVTYLESKELITSQDQDLLKEYTKSLKMLYEKYNTLDYYNNQVTKKNNSIISITKINYDKIDMKEWLKLDKSNRSILKHNKVSFHKLVKKYKQNESTCHYIY